MPVGGIGLTRSRSDAGELVMRLGVPVLDEYLDFLGGRCRPNTISWTGYCPPLTPGSPAIRRPAMTCKPLTGRCGASRRG